MSMIDNLKSKIFDFEQGKSVFCCMITAENADNGEIEIDIKLTHHGLCEETRQAIVAEALVVLAQEHGLAEEEGE